MKIFLYDNHNKNHICNSPKSNICTTKISKVIAEYFTSLDNDIIQTSLLNEFLDARRVNVVAEAFRQGDK